MKLEVEARFILSYILVPDKKHSISPLFDVDVQSFFFILLILDFFMCSALISLSRMVSICSRFFLQLLFRLFSLTMLTSFTVFRFKSAFCVVVLFGIALCFLLFISSSFISLSSFDFCLACLSFGSISAAASFMVSEMSLHLVSTSVFSVLIVLQICSSALFGILGAYAFSSLDIFSCDMGPNNKSVICCQHPACPLLRIHCLCR